MRFYRVNGDSNFDIAEVAYSGREELVKLKVSLISPRTIDIAIFQGKLDIAYPVTPCSMATAIVSEDRPEYGLKRGTKVMLNPYSTENINIPYAEKIVYGVHKDGFLANFIEFPANNIIPFPEDVKEEEAVFADLISVAIKALNTLNIQKGSYIAILGGSLLNNIIAQIALYYQTIPIIISSDERYLALAKKSGIHYVIDELKETVSKRVFDITGGRMAEYSVVHALPWVSPGILPTITARNGECVMVSVSSAFVPKMTVNISEFTQKNLTLRGVSSGHKEFSAAANILGQKTLKLKGFIDKMVSLDEVKDLFDQMAASPTRYLGPVIKV